MSLFDKVKSKGKKLIGHPEKDDPRVVSSTEWIDRVKAKMDVSKSLSQTPLKLRATHSLSVTYSVCSQSFNGLP